MSLLRILAADVLRCSHLSVMIISILKKPKKLELWIQIMLLVLCYMSTFCNEPFSLTILITSGKRPALGKMFIRLFTSTHQVYNPL